jgi:hypothetical protein
MVLISLLFETVWRSLKDIDKEGEEKEDSKGVGHVPPPIATATNALNSLK